MASSLTAFSTREPSWLHWQPLSPLVAATTLWSLGRIWHHQFSWPVWAALGLSAWAGTLVSHWSHGEPDQAGRRPLLLAGALGLISVLIAVRWLPRGLVLSAVPVGGLAFFQALISLGNQRPWARHLAVAGATLGAVGLVATAPPHWPSSLRLGLIALTAVSAWSMWKSAHRVAIAEAPLVVARGLVFAAGVLLPVAWWLPRGLVEEMARPENLVFAVFATVAAACRSEWRQRAPSLPRLAAYAVAALILTGVSVVGVWTTPAGPVRGVFAGVGAAALLLATGIALGLRSPLSRVWPRLVPDLAWLGLVLVALRPWPLL